MNTMTDSVCLARAEFIETMGTIVQREHLPRIAGRVLGVLIFDAKPTSFGSLATGLDVSRGSISASARLLEDRGLIRRIGQRGKRGDFFVLADKAYDNLLLSMKARAELAEQEIDETLKLIPESQRDLRQRIEGFTNFYKCLVESVDITLEKMNISCGCAKKNKLATGQSSGEKE